MKSPPGQRDPFALAVAEWVAPLVQPRVVSIRHADDETMGLVRCFPPSPRSLSWGSSVHTTMPVAVRLADQVLRARPERMLEAAAEPLAHVVDLDQHDSGSVGGQAQPEPARCVRRWRPARRPGRPGPGSRARLPPGLPAAPAAGLRSGGGGGAQGAAAAGQLAEGDVGFAAGFSFGLCRAQRSADRQRLWVKSSSCDAAHGADLLQGAIVEPCNQNSGNQLEQLSWVPGRGSQGCCLAQSAHSRGDLHLRLHQQRSGSSTADGWRNSSTGSAAPKSAAVRE